MLRLRRFGLRCASSPAHLEFPVAGKLATGRSAEAGVFSAVNAIPPPGNPLNSPKTCTTGTLNCSHRPEPRTQNPEPLTCPARTAGLDLINLFPLAATPPRRAGDAGIVTFSSLHRETRPLAAEIAILTRPPSNQATDISPVSLLSLTGANSTSSQAAPKSSASTV